MNKARSNNISIKYSIFLIALIIGFSFRQLNAQPNDAASYIVGKIKNQQRRIDLFDSIIDNKVRFENQPLADKIQQSLFIKVNDLILLIEKERLITKINLQNWNVS